jgi:hypothetical protein
MWPSLISKLDKPTPTTSSTLVNQYPPTQAPSYGRPIPSMAATQRRRGGCQTQSKPEREELEQFWKPLIKEATQKARAAKLVAPTTPHAKPGKQCQPVSPPTTQLNSWMQADRAAQKSNKENPRPNHADAPMGRSQGKKRLVSLSACVNFHPFMKTLRDWEEGIPVDCGNDWTLDQIDAAIAQGPHQSAMTPKSLKMITEDIAYQVRAGYAEIVAWLRENMPAQLKIPP